MVLPRALVALVSSFPLATAGAAGGQIEASSLVDPLLRAVASPNGHSNTDNRRDLQSADGRFAVFASMASNLDANVTDANGDTDAWLFDRDTGALTLVSRGAGGAQRTAAGRSRPVAISRDGARVLFLSTATDLVAGQVDGNDAEDAFLFERDSGQVQLVSHRASSATAAGNAGVIDAQLSADGQMVLFSTLSTDLALVTDNNGQSDVYRYDLLNRVPQPVSTSGANGGFMANGRSVLGDVAFDGSRMAIVSNATNLIAGQGATSVDQVYTFERFGNARTLVSHAATGALQPGNAVSNAPRFTPDGGKIVFVSQATDLVAGVTDANNGSDVFLHALAGGTNGLVSFADGNPAKAANGASSSALASQDGERIVFASAATDLIAGFIDANGSGLDVYLHERGGTRLLVSHRAGSATTGGSGSSSLLHGLSDDGKQVLYRSTAPDLVAGQVDAPNDVHIFRYSLGEDRNDLVSFRAGAPATASASAVTRASLSADGNAVLFDGGDDLGVGDDNARDDVWQWHAEKNRQLSLRDPAASNLATARNGGRSEPRSLSDDGRHAVYFSISSDLVAGMADGFVNALYRSDRLDGSNVLISHVAGQPTTRSAGTLQREIALSGDGEYVVFLSNATDLRAGTLNAGGQPQAWLARADGSDAVLASHAANDPSAAGNGAVIGAPLVSRDGRFVAYLSRATDLIAGYTGPAVENLWLYDRESGTNTLVNHALGNPARSDGAATINFALAPDGAHVAFATAAAGVSPLPDGNGSFDVFLHVTATGENLPVSRSHGNARMAQGSSDSPDLSDDGGVVVFRSTANDLQATPATGSFGIDVFRWQRSDDSVALVTRHATDAARHTDAGAAFLQTDAAGRRVLFTSAATTLVAGFVNQHGAPALYDYDHADGQVRLLDHGAGTASTTLGDPIVGFVLARGGTHAAFITRATNVVAGSTDGAGSLDTFVVDLDTDERFIASHRFGQPLVTASAQNAPAAIVPSISRDGMITAFGAQSRDMMLHDVNGVADAHRFILLEPTTLRATAPEPSPVRVGEAYEVHAEVDLVRGPALGRIRVDDGEAACEFQLEVADDSRGSCVLASATAGEKILSIAFTSTEGFAASATTVEQRVLPPLATDLSLALEAPATVDTGALFELQATVANAGPDEAPDLRIDFQGLPATVGFTGSGWSCGPDACMHGALPAGAVTGVTLQLSAPLQDGPLALSATVSSARDDADREDNSVAHAVAVDGVPRIARVSPVHGSTEGGFPMQIAGDNFGAAIGSVQLGSFDCAVSVWTMTQIVCTVPAGAGVHDVEVIQAATVLDRAAFGGFAYDAPRLDAIAPSIGAPEGSYSLTLTGRDFGASGATVSIAGLACTDVQHDAAQPHRRLTCRVPAGTGADLPVVVTQSAQSSDGAARFAYAAVVADLLIDKASARSEVFARSIDEWTLLVSNVGPDRADGARIVDALPPHLVAVSWTCTGLAGGACSASEGVGDVDLTADLPAGGSALVQVSARLPRAPLIDVVNTARVDAPPGLADPAPDNNIDTEIDPMATIFFDEFE